MVWYGGGENRRLHADHQGSIIAVTSGSGAIRWINGYDEWGIPNDPSNTGRFQYTGQAWIAELGLYHYKARLYSPTLGRFLQTDPVGYDDDINLYAYVGNDPVNLVDPTGQSACDFSPTQCGSRELTPEDERRIESASGTMRSIALTMIPVGGAIRGALWLARAFGLGTRALSQATRAAMAGGRHSSLIVQYAQLSTTSLNSTIRSLTRRIEQHQEKIRNPAAHMTRERADDPAAVRRAVNDWRREIRNYSEQRDIARDVVRARESCTGTRIC